MGIINQRVSIAADAGNVDSEADALPCDLRREVYCVLGMPIDALDISEVLERIDAAVRGGKPYLISTPNLNFLALSRENDAFREVLLRSDLCPADGMPIVWVARIMGLPIRQRVAGADFFDALVQRKSPFVKVYLFGGTEQASAAAAQALNSADGGVQCVGAMSPGFGPVEEMSSDEIIETINASGADLLAVSLGAQKGQAWLAHNHERVRIPIRAHLGAAINFQSGTLRRAPAFFSRVGLEWLWRIKEEPPLWRRYRHDGGVLLRLLFSHVLPLATSERWQRRRAERRCPRFRIERNESGGILKLELVGAATTRFVDEAIDVIRAGADVKVVTVDLSAVDAIDARFLGFLLMLRKQVRNKGGILRCVGASTRLTRTLHRHGAEFILE